MTLYTIVIDDHSLDPNIEPEPEPTVSPSPEPTEEPAQELTLKATSRNGKVILAWNALEKATEYRIYKKKVPLDFTHFLG